MFQIVKKQNGVSKQDKSTSQSTKKNLKRPTILAFSLFIALWIVCIFFVVLAVPISGFHQHVISNVRLAVSGIYNVPLMLREAFRPTMQTKESSRLFDNKIPNHVWMLCDKGWDKAPPLQAMCLRSFKRHNPDYAIHALDLAEAEYLIRRPHYYPDSIWQRASIQTKSDIIRLELLSSTGGVWADDNVYCNKPLSNWVNTVGLEKSPAGLFAYEKTRDAVHEEMIPWISAWFMIATNNSRFVRTWRDSVRRAWSDVTMTPQHLGYFWIYRILANLTKTDAVFQQDFKTMKYLYGNGDHKRGVADHVSRLI